MLSKHLIPVLLVSSISSLWLTACKSESAKPVPLLRDISPNRVPVGTSVTITGEHFSTTAANNQLTFNGIAAPVTAATATTLTATVPAGVFNEVTGPLDAKIAVVTEGRQSLRDLSLLSDTAPEFLAVDPVAARVGETIVIRGRNFNATAARNIAIFPTATAGGAVSGTIVTVTPTAIQVTVPQRAVSGQLNVWTSPTTNTAIQYGHQFSFSVTP